MTIENKNNFGQDDYREIVFLTFCFWSFILLGRPQDYIAELSAIRPGLSSTLLMLTVIFFYSGQVRGPSFDQEGQVKYYSALLLTMVVGIPGSLYARLSFNTIFTEYIVVILYFFIFYKVVNTVSKLTKVLWLGCLGCGIYFAVSLFSFALNAGRLSYGSMFDSNDLAYFALAFLPFNLLFIGRNNALMLRLTCLGAFGVGTLTILLSGSRGGLLAFVIALIILLTRASAVKLSVKFLLLFACLVSLIFAPIDRERFSTMFNLNDDYNLRAETGRFAIWNIGLNTLLENPLTGVGVKNFPRAVGEDRKARDASTLRWQVAHNSLIQIGAETGFVGLFIYCMLSLNVVRIFRKSSQEVPGMKLTGIAEMGLAGFIGMFVSSMFLSQAYSIYCVFYFAMSAVVNQIAINEKKYLGAKS